MSVQQYPIVDYGLTQALQNVFPAPIVSNRAPTTADKAQIGTLWIEPKDVTGAEIDGVWVLTSIISNVAHWANLTGGSGNFASIQLPFTTTPNGGISFGGIRTISVPEATSIFVGSGAGNVTYTGNHDTGVGTLALAALTTGSSNTTLGYLAGADLTSGSNNTAIGANALDSATTSVGNTMVGSGSGLSITTGTGTNTAVGFANLLALTTGAANIALGTGVLNGIVTGAGNIGLGNGAGSALVTGNESGNIYLGALAVGVNGESNVMRLTSNGGAFLTVTGATNTLELVTNGMVIVDSVLAIVASPTATLTANQRVIRVRFTGFTTAAAGLQNYTIVSSQILANNPVLVTVTNLNASTNNAMIGIQGITQAAGSVIVHTINNSAGALGAGDDVNVTIWVLD